MFSTHDKQMSQAFSSGSELSPLKTLFDEYDVIGIDEGQFFTDIEEFCEEAVNAGKVVIIAACDATFQKKAFGKVLQLVPLSDSVIKLCAVCVTCFRDAPSTARLSGEEALEVIGGAEKYAAMCRKCHNQVSNWN
jgi:thymidine kinase